MAPSWGDIGLAGGTPASWGLVNKNAPGAAGPALLLLVPGQGRSRGSKDCLESRCAPGLAGAEPPEDGLRVACTEGTTSEQGL